MKVATSPGPSSPVRGPASLRTALILCGVALVLHVALLFLPRDTAEQELAIARAIPEARHRVSVLKPLATHPKALGAELREAATLLLPDAPAEARLLATEAERRDPKSAESHLLLARVCHLERSERCVSEQLAQARTLAPQDPRPDLFWADVQEGEGALAAALEAVQAARSKVPKEAALALREGRLWLALKQPERAEAVLQPLSAMLTQAPQLVQLGQLRLEQHRVPEARDLFERALRTQPSLWTAHHFAGLTRLQQGDLAGAETAFRKAASLSPADPRPLLSLCALQARTGRREAARIAQLELMRRFPEQAESWGERCPLEPPSSP